MWGEIIEPFKEPEEDDLDISNEIEMSHHPDCLSFYNIESRIEETKEITLPSMDPRMLYATELHNYKASMTDIIQDAELAVEFQLVLQKSIPDSSIPEKLNVKEIHQFTKPMNYIEKEYSNFTKGIGKDPPYLSEYSRRLVEQQCIATMFAHIGFKNTYDDVMETLTDVLEAFFKNICNQLRTANDSVLSGRPNGFPDIVEQILTQSGLGGLQGIYDYYENRVKKYQSLLEQQCGILSVKYKDLVTPGNVAQNMKVEKVDDDFMDEKDIPEVHFTAGDGEGDYLQPFLESGFQMLNSLEEGQFVG